MDDHERADIPFYLLLYGCHNSIMALSLTGIIENTINSDAVCAAIFEGEQTWWTLLRVIEVPRQY